MKFLYPAWTSDNLARRTKAVARINRPARLYKIITSGKAYPDVQVLAARKLADEKLASEYVLGLLHHFVDENTAQMVAALAANMKSQATLYGWYNHLAGTDSYTKPLKKALYSITGAMDEGYIVNLLCSELVFCQEILRERVAAPANLARLAKCAKREEDRQAAERRLQALEKT